jgi:hypothetical protein
LDAYIQQVEDETGGNKFLELRRLELWSENPENETPLTPKQSLESLRQLFWDQERIVTEERDVKALRAAPRQLPNLRRIILTSEAWRPYYVFPLYETPFFRGLK